MVCIRPRHNHEFREVVLLPDHIIDKESLEDIKSEADLLKELTGYAGQLPQFKEVRDLNMRRKLYLDRIMDQMIENRLNRTEELKFFDDPFIMEIISTIRKQEQAEKRRQRCLEILLKPISCWADLF